MEEAGGGKSVDADDGLDDDKTNWDSERGLKGDAVVRVEWRSWREDWMEVTATD